MPYWQDSDGTYVKRDERGGTASYMTVAGPVAVVIGCAIALLSKIRR